MDFQETDEQLMLRDAVSNIARQYGHDYFVEQARAGLKGDELWADLGGHGFLGVNLPTEHGGGGMGIAELAIVEEECAAAGCPLLILLVSPGICGTVISRLRLGRAAGALAPRASASGGSKMAFAITEPDAGSNSHQISTTATRDGDGYRLNGTKYYISCVDEAEAMVVVARTGVNELTGRGELSLFIVDCETEGPRRQVIPVEIVTTELQFTLFFDDVGLSADRLIGSEGGGLTPLFAGLNPERIISAALLNGAARYALDKAAAYANERQVWGVPIGAHQGIAHPLAKAKVDVELARLMTAKAAWMYDAGLDAGEASNMAKFAAADASLAAPRPGDADPRRQRHGHRVRAGHDVGHDAAAADRSGQPRDDPQLRGAALPGPAALVLSSSSTAGPPAAGCDATRPCRSTRTAMGVPVTPNAFATCRSESTSTGERKGRSAMAGDGPVLTTTNSSIRPSPSRPSRSGSSRSHHPHAGSQNTSTRPPSSAMRSVCHGAPTRSLATNAGAG